MDRRNVLRLFANTMIFSLWQPWQFVTRALAAGRPRQLFFEPEELERIRANAETALLRPYIQECLEADIAADRKFIKGAAHSRDLIGDMRRLINLLRREGVVYLVTQDQSRKDLLLDTIEVIMQMPKWDYFLDGENRTFGLQRAPGVTIALLFAQEVLGSALDQKLRGELLTQIAEKGCVPSYRALWGMEHKAETVGWHFDPEYIANYEITMRRWPQILDRTNLKAIPIAGLGMGAMALEGIDRRADEWLRLAVHSAKEYLELFAKDGSYFEGLSYADYSMRNLFIFFETHMKLHGDIDWYDMMNFAGFTEFLVCMQAGRQADADVPDIVNFSDAKMSFHLSVPLWVAMHGKDPLALYAAEQFSAYNYFTDIIWYRSSNAQKAAPPQASLKNKRFDLDWIVCRTGWDPDDSVIAFRSGKPSNHEHADRNSFFFKAYGERLLTDHVGAAYDWRDKAWLLRLTEAHNAVLIDGKGHQYHTGVEGTNSSLAEAKVVRFVDRGDVVWWCSDATQAYQLMQDDVRSVMRSVLFIKPDLLVLFDHIEKNRVPSTVALRFHPDNRDGKAKLTAGSGARFEITRPKAALLAQSFSDAPLQVEFGTLDVPPNVRMYASDGAFEKYKGDAIFPFAEISSAKAKQVQIATVLVARPKGRGGWPKIQMRRDEHLWSVKIGERDIQINASGHVPEFFI